MCLHGCTQPMTNKREEQSRLAIHLSEYAGGKTKHGFWMAHTCRVRGHQQDQQSPRGKRSQCSNGPYTRHQQGAGAGGGALTRMHSTLRLRALSMDHEEKSPWLSPERGTTGYQGPPLHLRPFPRRFLPPCCSRSSPSLRFRNSATKAPTPVESAGGDSVRSQVAARATCGWVYHAATYT